MKKNNVILKTVKKCCVLFAAAAMISAPLVSHSTVETMASTTGAHVLTGITAESKGAAYYIDEPKASVLKKLVNDVEIKGVFADGKNETIANKEEYFTNVPAGLKGGEASILIQYRVNSTTVLSTELKVKVVQAPIKSMTAEYTGGSVIQNKAIPLAGFKVTMTDIIGAKHVITDFKISPQVATTVPTTPVTITYDNMVTAKPINVPTIPLTVTKLTADYTGTAMEQGQNISKSQILVTATFNDGTARNLKEDEFDLGTTLVSQIGMNTFTVYYRATEKSETTQAKFKVKGIAAVVPSTYGAIRATVKRGSYATDVYIDTLGKYIRQNFMPNLTVPSKDNEKSQILQAVQRVNKTSKYIGMNINLDGYQFDKNNTAKLRFSVPYGFNYANTALYYTPDMKKKMGQVPGYLYKDPTTGAYFLRTFIYRSGWYVIMEKNEATSKENTLREDETPVYPILVAYSAPTVMHVKDIAHPKATLLYSEEELEYTYKSTDPSILLIEDVSSGKMKALKEGTANVILTSTNGKYTYTYTVTVEKALKKKKTEKKK